jgi:isocitrate/isopropylmalate dehydrogenase
MSAHPLRIAVLPGDGIGREVIAEVIAEVMQLAEAVRRAGHLATTWEELDWGADRYLATGQAMPAGGIEDLRDFDHRGRGEGQPASGVRLVCPAAAPRGALGTRGRAWLDAAVAAAVRDGAVTPDLGGKCTTAEVGKAVRERMMEQLAE